MRKYILVKLLEDVPIGREFSAATWPLHLTLVDDFLVGLDEAEMRQALSEMRIFPCAKTAAMGDDLLGPLKTVPVTLMELTSSLLSLHLSLVDFLKQIGAVLVSPEFAGNGYKPHVTIHGARRIVAGSEMIVDTVSLVAMSPDGKACLRLLDTVQLSEMEQLLYKFFGRVGSDRRLRCSRI